MIKILRLLGKTAAIIFALTAVFIAIFSLGQTYAEPDSFAESADMIVVLGGGIETDNTLTEPSKLRAAKAAELYQAGAAPMLLFTGGQVVEAGPSAAEEMAKIAISLGVPPEAILTENNAHNTLQNALYSMPDLRSANKIIIVTEGFHLLRAWLSFQWAAHINDQPLEITLAHTPVYDPQTGAKLLVTETLSLWLNLGRVAAWYGGSWLSTPRETRDNWLQ